MPITTTAMLCRSALSMATCLTSKPSPFNVTNDFNEDVNSAPSADFDGNGRSDLLWRNGAGQIAVWQTNSSGVLASAVALGSAPAIFHIDGAGDFNHDSRGDILFRGDDGTLAVWQTNGQQIQSITVLGSAPSDWRSSGIGDFNGDGTSDLLFRNVDGQIAQWIINNNQIQSIRVLVRHRRRFISLRSATSMATVSPTCYSATTPVCSRLGY